MPVYLLLATLALLLSTQRLTTPPHYVFDEFNYVYTAQYYVDGQEAYDSAILPRDDPALEWTHPPLAKLIIAGSILAAGDNPLGWRLASVLFGVAGVCLTGHSLADLITLHQEMFRYHRDLGAVHAQYQRTGCSAPVAPRMALAASQHQSLVLQQPLLDVQATGVSRQ